MAFITFDKLRLHRCAFEIRHPSSYLYWDNCGKCILDIVKATNGKFDFKELRGGQECALKTDDSPFTEFSFGYQRTILASQNLRDVNLFKKYVPILFESVKQNLDIKEISRIGFRLWFIYKTDSEDDASSIINKSSIYNISFTRFEGFGREIKACDPVIIISEGSEKIRISLNAAHRQSEYVINPEDNDAEEYSPKYCLLIDLDFFIEDAPPIDTNLSEFISKCYNRVKNNISNIINSPR